MAKRNKNDKNNIVPTITAWHTKPSKIFWHKTDKTKTQNMSFLNRLIKLKLFYPSIGNMIFPDSNFPPKF